MHQVGSLLIAAASLVEWTRWPVKLSVSTAAAETRCSLFLFLMARCSQRT